MDLTNVTLTDVQLASAYYPILVDLAKHKHCLTYGELVDRAKQEYSDSPTVQKAIAVSTGRRLNVVRMFTDMHKYPDLSALIINKGTGDPGDGFPKTINPAAAREDIFEFDWNNVSMDFDGFIRTTEDEVTPRKRVKEAKALEIMSEYYLENKHKLPNNIKDVRELIVELLMDGFETEKAFCEAAKILLK